MTDRPDLPSFRHLVAVGELGDEPREAALTAAPEDRTAIAAFLDIPEVKALSGSARVTRSGPLIHVTGDLHARLGRTCVASLEPMEEGVREAFSVTFTTEPPAEDLPEEMEADLDAPEPLEGDALDLGGVLLEQLVLAMSPHPRKDGAEPPADPGAGARISPFDVLERLKKD